MKHPRFNIIHFPVGRNTIFDDNCVVFDIKDPKNPKKLTMKEFEDLDESVRMEQVELPDE